MKQVFVSVTTTLLIILIALLAWTTVGWVFNSGAALLSPTAVENEQTSVESSLPVSVKRYHSVESYFRDGNPNALSHRLGLPRHERDVSASRKRMIKNRDGNACLICGATDRLEVDHVVGLQNGGDNSDENLKTLCHDCHVRKTKIDKSIRRKRDKLFKEQRSNRKSSR